MGNHWWHPSKACQPRDRNGLGSLHYCLSLGEYSLAHWDTFRGALRQADVGCEEGRAIAVDECHSAQTVRLLRVDGRVEGTAASPLAHYPFPATALPSLPHWTGVLFLVTQCGQTGAQFADQTEVLLGPHAEGLVHPAVDEGIVAHRENCDLVKDHEDAVVKGYLGGGVSRSGRGIYDIPGGGQ